MASDTDWIDTIVGAVARHDSRRVHRAVFLPGVGTLAAASPALAAELDDPATRLLELATAAGVDLTMDAGSDPAQGTCVLGYETMTFTAACVHGPTTDSGRITIATICPADNDFQDPTPERPPIEELTFVHDRANTVLMADGRLSRVGMNPLDEVGTNGCLQVHPMDLDDLMGLVRDVIEGVTDEAVFQVRAIGPGERWTPVLGRARPLAGGSAAYVATYTFDPGDRKHIPDGALTDAEREVVRLLYGGQRIQHVARTRGVSVRTVRNQLSSVFRKLGVGDQAELLQRYVAPPRQRQPS